MAERTWAPRTFSPASCGAPFAQAARADVDVLVVRGPGEPDPNDLVADLLTGTVLARGLLLGEDGVTPPRGPAVPTAAGKPYPVLRHAAPLGRGLTRNALLAASTASRLLVLDAGMRASPFLLTRLLEACEQGARIAHCPVADPTHGLVGALPAELRQLRTLPYLGSGYLVDRAVLEGVRGWTEEPELEGLEDRVFWLGAVLAEYPSTLVQQVLLSRMRPDPALRPIDLDPARVWALAGTAAG